MCQLYICVISITGYDRQDKKDNSCMTSRYLAMIGKKGNPCVISQYLAVIGQKGQPMCDIYVS